MFRSYLSRASNASPNPTSASVDKEQARVPSTSARVDKEQPPLPRTTTRVAKEQQQPPPPSTQVSVSKEKQQLEKLESAQVGENVGGIDITSTDQIDAAGYASTLFDLFSKVSANGGKQHAKSIARLTLQVLRSNDRQKIANLCEWLQWMCDVTEDSVNPLMLSLTTMSVIERKQKELEQNKLDVRHNPGDLPAGWSGIDARVIDEGSESRYDSASNGIVNRTRGTKVVGGLPSDMNKPLLATTHTFGTSTTFKGQGQFNEHLGAVFSLTEDKAPAAKERVPPYKH